MTCLPDEEVRRGVRSYSGSLPRPRTSGARQVRVDDDDRDKDHGDDHYDGSVPRQRTSGARQNIFLTLEPSCDFGFCIKCDVEDRQ